MIPWISERSVSFWGDIAVVDVDAFDAGTPDGAGGGSTEPG